MKTYILYTTSTSGWYQEQADIFASEISKTKGRGEVNIVVKNIRIKDYPDLYVDKDGDILPKWSWFRSICRKNDYDGVILHFTPMYRKRWGIKSGQKGKIVNGSRNKDNREYPEFWVCSEKEMSDGYDLSQFLRLLFHEHAHFDEDLDDKLGNLLTQTSVHDFDYRLKKIHLYHYVVDYRGQNFKEKVNKVINDVVKLVKRFI